MKRLAIFAVATALSASAFPQWLYSNQSPSVNVAALNAQLTTRSGVGAAPPAGGMWSEVQANGAGPQPESNTVAGFTGSISGTTGIFRLADDFTVTGPGWNVTDVHTYGYNTGTAIGFSPIAGGSLNFWNGRPGDATSAIIGTATFSSMDNDIIVDPGGATANLYRIFNTNSPPPGTVQGTARVIREVNWVTNLTLAPGTYWIDYQYIPTTAGAAIFNPSTTHQDLRGVAGANARQMTSAGVWVDAIDAGNPGTAADVNQDLPFLITGTPVPEPGTMIALGAGIAALAARRRRKTA